MENKPFWVEIAHSLEINLLSRATFSKGEAILAQNGSVSEIGQLFQKKAIFCMFHLELIMCLDKGKKMTLHLSPYDLNYNFLLCQRTDPFVFILPIIFLWTHGSNTIIFYSNTF